MLSRGLLAFILAFLSAVQLLATVFGTVGGIVHDPQHHPIQGAELVLRARSSDWSRTSQTGDNGEFRFMAVPVGEYALVGRHPGFREAEQEISVRSGSAPVIHFALALAEVKQTVEV
ncbi:MAG TPA: carboxypeptidase-like regulatory domain-containing protein, partial [Acidobacteriota bacterium]|nr:carboxypeptidase-like regulatory domain-containing protein [Acidobacteriota bacterium]